MSIVPLTESPDEQTSEMKRIVVASIVGTAVEWYDFDPRYGECARLQQALLSNARRDIRAADGNSTGAVD